MEIKPGLVIGAMALVNAASLLPCDPFYVHRDHEGIETEGNLLNWVTVTLIAHVVVISGFLKLAQLYHPRLIPRADGICLMLNPGETLLQPAGDGKAAAASAPPSKQQKISHPSVAHTPPTHQLKTTPVPATPPQPAVSNILASISIPRPLWSAPQTAQGEATDQSVAGGSTSANSTGNSNGAVAGAGPGSSLGTGPGSGSGTGLSMLPPGTGNIAPYRKYLLIQLSRRWKPSVSPVDVVLLLKIGKDGKLLSSEIYQSSGNKKADNEALRAARSLKYPRLPEWFGGSSLKFRIELASAGTQR